MNKRRWLRLSALVLAVLVPAPPALAAEFVIRIGSKPFTESVILAEIVRHLCLKSGYAAVHRAELGGSQIVWKALQAGEIDVYPEYLGTLLGELLAGEEIKDGHALAAALKKHGIGMIAPLGFSNSYALGLREETAERLHVHTIADLAKFPELRFGLSDEFMERKGDGWPGLKQRYGLPGKGARPMHHSLALRGLASDKIDVTDLYSTDAEILHYGLRALKDNLNFFPAYDAVLLYRLDLDRHAPGAENALRKLVGALPEKEMMALNGKVQVAGESESRAAAEFLNRRFDAKIDLATVEGESLWQRRLERFWRNTYEHLFLVFVSLTLAVLISVPLGVLSYKVPALGQPILATVGVIQTLPSMALLVFMIPLLGLGAWPAITALFLYSLLPIVRNTYQGLVEIPTGLRESAQVLGLPPRARLWRVELPMASRSILTGIKIAAVINVGTATIGALIGAGGYGEPILTGIRLDDVGLILQGAVPAAALALLVQGLFGLAERWVVPRGLRLQSA